MLAASLARQHQHQWRVGMQSASGIKSRSAASSAAYGVMAAK